jgi:small basic protein (TIGR04137 family)
LEKNSTGAPAERMLQAPAPHERIARIEPENLLMSQHRSLRASSTLGAKRNVLKRYERVELLKKRGQWKQGDKVVGLRKTKPEA